MRGGSTPLRGALLGLVLERPGHGGDLASRLQARLGEAWPIHGNDVYRLLEGLEAEGLLSCTPEPRRSGHRGTHMVYRPTPLTSEALRDWMQTLAPREPARRAIEAKLAVAREQDLASLSGALRAHQSECLEISASIGPPEAQPRSWRALCRDCAREGAQRVLQAEIDWAEATIRRIEEHARAAG